MERFDELTYEFYPKGISAIKDRTQYNMSVEHKRLLEKLDEDNSLYNLKELASLKYDIEREFNVIIEDHTVVVLQDRCYNWQFVLDTDLKTLKKFIMCINISKIIPYYLVYILEVEFNELLGRLKYLPRRNIIMEQIHKPVIDKIQNILISRIREIKSFSKDKLENKIVDVSFQDIEFGSFTMFNAFFLNDFTTKFA